MTRYSYAGFAVALSLSGCALPAPANTDANANTCQDAQDHLASCLHTDVRPATTVCDGDAQSAAQEVLAMGCDELSTAGKADGFWCGWAVRFLGFCDEDQPVVDPDAAFCIAKIGRSEYGFQSWFRIDCDDDDVFYSDDGENTADKIEALESLMAGHGYTSEGKFDFDEGSQFLFQRSDLVGSNAGSFCLALDLAIHPTSLGGETRYVYRLICDELDAIITLNDHQPDTLQTFVGDFGYEKRVDFSAQHHGNNVTYTRALFAR